MLLLLLLLLLLLAAGKWTMDDGEAGVEEENHHQEFDHEPDARDLLRFWLLRPVECLVTEALLLRHAHAQRNVPE